MVAPPGTSDSSRKSIPPFEAESLRAGHRRFLSVPCGIAATKPFTPLGPALVPMPLYIAQHKHPAAACPAGHPQMAGALLQIVNGTNAAQAGIQIHGDAVADGGHHLFLIVEAADEGAVRQYFAPFAQLGSLEITPASHCEQVVERGHC
jgi:uncharacterized protein DUF3303